jgi:hypothetical protein
LRIIYLRLELGGCTFEELLDSGVARTFISDSVLSYLHSSGGIIHESPVLAKCLTATDQSFQPESLPTCELCIDRLSLKLDFFVMQGLVHPVMLGADFIFLGGGDRFINGSEGKTVLFFRFDSTNCPWLHVRSLLASEYDAQLSDSTPVKLPP